MINLRVIGDVHGKIDYYIQLAKESYFSIQLGDLSFNYDKLGNLDSNFHKVIAGNHDNYTKENGKFVKQTNHFLGDFGVVKIPSFTEKVFFVRGANSIDKQLRTEGVNYWRDEELTYSNSLKALEEYKKEKPDFVFSHTCPAFITKLAFGYKTWHGQEIRSSMTDVLLEQMFEYHKPKMWIFGHHHKSWKANINDCQFQCLAELECFDFSS